MDLAAAAGTVAVVLVDGGGVADAAVDEAVGAGSRKHVAADGAGGAAVGVFGGGPPVVCVVGVGVVGDDAVGSTADAAAAADGGDGMGGFVLYLNLDAFPQVHRPSCPSLYHVLDPSCSLWALFPSAPCSEAALEGDVFVVCLVGEEDLHVLV